VVNNSVIITAGFAKSQGTLALAELLIRNNVEVRAIIVTKAINLKRLKRELRSKGKWFIKNAFKKIFASNKGKSLFANYLGENNIRVKSLSSWAKNNNVRYIETDGLNSPYIEEIINQLKPSYLVYSGGGIIRPNIIKAMNGNIINIHSGPLPEVRGMNAAEWTVLLGLTPTVTIHYIDAGIDTGALIAEEEIPINGLKSIEELRDIVLVKGIQLIVKIILENKFDKLKSFTSKPLTRQCFVLSTALQELVSIRLKNSAQT